MHALLRCPICNAGRVREHRDYAGARGIWSDVRDMIVYCADAAAPITSTRARWALVRDMWSEGAGERAAEAGVGAEMDGNGGGGRVRPGGLPAPRVAASAAVVPRLSSADG